MQKTITAALFALAIVSLVGTAMAEDKTESATIGAEIGKEGHERTLTGNIQVYDTHVSADIQINNGDNSFSDDDVEFTLDSDDERITQIVIQGDSGNHKITKKLTLEVEFVDESTYLITGGELRTSATGNPQYPTGFMIKLVPVNGGAIIFTTPS